MCCESVLTQFDLLTSKTIMKKLLKNNKRIPVISKSVGVIGLVSRDMERFFVCHVEIGTHEW